MDKTKKIQHSFVRLPLEGVSNCRDLGGYYATSGGMTKWNTLLRSSRISNLKESDIEFLYDYGVRSIIDLRANFEIKESANALSEHPDFNYFNIDMIGTVERASTQSQWTDNPHVLGQMYVNLLKDQRGIKEVLNIMINEIEHGGVMFHCSAGKDRTGVIALLLLGLAGVEKQDIITNYEVSATNIKKDYLDGKTNFKPNVLGSDPENIIMAYDYIMEHHHSFENYFQSLGYTKEEIDRFLEKYVEDFKR